MSQAIEPFNNFAEKYDRWYEKYHWVYQSEVFAVERLLPRRANAVEIGVGTGRFSSSFNIKTGVDPSQNMLKLARARDIHVIQGVAETLPFHNESFNLVLMVTTICFLNDIKRSLKEANRILTAGGQLVIGFIDRLSPLGMKYQQEKEASIFFKQATFYSPEELTELLGNAYFEDILFVQTLFNPLDEICQIEPVKNGYGRGSFVVARGIKY